MNTQHPNELENGFLQEDPRLQDFYEHGSSNLSLENEEFTYPILNALLDKQERYQEIQPIAEGGEKKITCVYDRLLNRKVAMARSALAKNRKEQEEFLREAHLESNLAHPNIVPVHNIGIDSDNTPFFTMELLPGDDLNIILTKRKKGDLTYSLNALLEIFIKICDAISYAHSRRVLHLDIKPENIKVGQFGEVFVCDWGLAHIISSDTSIKPDTPGELDADLLNHMTLTGVIKGSLGYMAPEQTRADGEKTEQTDIYGLGATLYTILTLQNPIQGDSKHDIIKKTQEGKIGDAHRRLKHHAPKGLIAVALKAMSLAADQRYSSVIQLKDEISRYLSGFPTTAEHAGPLKHFNLFIQRHSRTASLLIFSLIILAISTTYYLNVIQQKAAATERAKQEAEAHLDSFQKQQTISAELNKNLTESIRQFTPTKNIAPTELIDIIQLGQDKQLQRSEKRKLLQYQASLHFILQEFNSAVRCFEDLSIHNHDLLTISRQFALLKPDDNQQLTFAQLTLLVEEAKKPLRDVLHLYQHHMKTAPPPSAEEYLPLAKAMLDRINQVPEESERPPFSLIKTNEGYHLNLSHYDYYNYTLSEIGFYKENILTPLKLHSLNISHTPIINPSALNGLNVKQLQMNGISMTRYRVLALICKNMKLKTLIVDDGFFPKQYLKKVNKQMEILVQHPENADAPTTAP